uniref:Uncharacterized protein n=1 Tax=Anguilla anguilla TaxID=7936 RepID=A0A0E9VLQ9_ANGAN
MQEAGSTGQLNPPLPAGGVFSFSASG